VSDRERVLAALRLAGSRGLHSHSIRRQGLSGHPSERCKELERQGYSIRREREYVNGRNGTRFFLEGEPPKAGVGISVGVPSPQGMVEAPSLPACADADSGESASGAVGTASDAPPRLFTPPAQSAITHPEAA